jgi:hypothetical protein
MPNGVASVAEAVELIALGTASGPMRLGPFSRVISPASTTVRVEGPPEPMMMPVRGFWMSFSSSPELAIASCMAM